MADHRASTRMKLQDVCHLITDGKHGDCENQEASGYYFLSCKDVRDGKLNYVGARQITEVDFLDTHRRTQLEPGDILVTNSGTIGRMAIAPKADRTHQTTFQKSVAIVKPDHTKVFNTWLYYYLLAEVERLIAFAGGTAQKNLLLRDMRTFEINVPPQSTQHRIASILSVYDDLIENNMRRITILEEMARRLYEEWFVHFRFPGHEDATFTETEHGRVPGGWKYCQLGEVSAFISRGISPKYDDDAECRVINQKCIRDHRLNMDLSRRQSKNVPEDKYVQFGDLLINSTGVGTLGRVAQVQEQFDKVTVDSHVTIARANDTMDKVFYGQQLLHLQPHFEDQGVGATGQTELSKTRVSETLVLHPSQPIQSRFGELVDPMKRQIQVLLSKNTNLRTQRDLLLPKLVAGEIDVSESEVALEDVVA
ncbi:restriction endonuclease subunit S [Thalassospiraceae bacterium LMO-JJ14]|nr:restriction endonuclease subunit S [Thalassospiraceae bacterium LMO-JJ14]